MGWNRIAQDAFGLLFYNRHCILIAYFQIQRQLDLPRSFVLFYVSAGCALCCTVPLLWAPSDIVFLVQGIHGLGFGSPLAH